MRTMYKTMVLLLPLLSAACATEDGAVSRFDVRHELAVKLPPNPQRVRIWFAIPADDAAQTIADFAVHANAETRVVRDAMGNKFLFAELDRPAVDAVTIKTHFRVERREVRSILSPSRTRAHDRAERERMRPYLESSTNIVIDDEIRRLAAEITKGEDNPILVARQVYDWVLGHVSYWVKHPERMKSSGIGSSQYCLKNGTGNCTDFHSLYTALARAAGVPTRMVYGSFLKGPLDGVDRDQSYHCWPEFHAPNLGWIPLDVAVADLYVGDFAVDDHNREKVSLTLADGYHGPDPEKVDYYFGNLDSRRVTWNIGRDLQLSPRQAGGPVNALPKAYVEVDGAPYKVWTRKLTFEERK